MLKMAMGLKKPELEETYISEPENEKRLHVDPYIPERRMSVGNEKEHHQNFRSKRFGQ